MSRIFALIGGISLGLVIGGVVMLSVVQRAIRDARKPRFAGKIPCDYCGDREPMDGLSQCGECGRLFCRGCFNIDPDDIYHGPWLCEECQKERDRKREPEVAR